MTYTDIDNLDHDPELAKALGNMVTAWANAESHLSMTLSIILDADANMILLGYYRIPTFEARVKFIRSLIPAWKTKLDKEAIDNAIYKLNALARTRNHWIHNLWCVNKDKTETVVFDYRTPDDDKGRRKPVRANDVMEHVKAVRKWTAELNSLAPEIRID